MYVCRLSVREHISTTTCPIFTNLKSEFEDSSFSRSRYISEGVKFQNGSRDPDHASFRDDSPSAGWDLLWST